MTKMTDSSSVDPFPKVWDENSRVGDMLKGKNGLIVGVANADSITFRCAAKLRAFGADIALTYLNEKEENTLNRWLNRSMPRSCCRLTSPSQDRSRRFSNTLKKNGVDWIF